MSAPEQQPEQRSSVKIKDLWKGEAPGVSVTVVDGADADELDRLRVLALETYRALKAEVEGRTTTKPLAHPTNPSNRTS